MNKTVHKNGCKLSGQVIHRDANVGLAFDIPTGRTQRSGRQGEEKEKAIKSRQRVWVSERDAKELFVQLAGVFLSPGALSDLASALIDDYGHGLVDGLEGEEA